MIATESNKQILIVDRDVAAIEPLRQKLSEAGFTVRAVTDGSAAVQVLAERPPHLVIIDWNSASVLEPSGSREVPEILEFATSQRLELRYYDSVLDAELAHIYDDYAIARRSWRSLVRSPYEKLARNVLRRFVELTGFTERVDNALKVVGDFYLARVYQSAVRRFRLTSWRHSIDEKQALVARSYDLLKGAVDIQRSTMLEVIVVALIAIELVAAWRGR